MRCTRTYSAITVTLLGILALAALIYWPGLYGGFTFDDIPNIVSNPRLQVDQVSLEGLQQVAFSSDSGPLHRPIAMLSFWVNYYVSGLNPFAFKLTNLCIHLLNGLLVFWLTLLLLAAFRSRNTIELSNSRLQRLALITTAGWLLHPLLLTSVLYVVQRMTSLSATFALAGLICYTLGRTRLDAGRRGLPLIILGVIGFGGLSAITKENGALLPALMLVIEITIFQFTSPQPTVRRKLVFFFMCCVGIPALAVLGFVYTHPHWIVGGYTSRPFTLTERLMTEARVLWDYVYWTVLPNIQTLSLYHDDIAVSDGLLAPVSTIASILAWIMAVTASLALRKRMPMLAFAVLWFLVGHSLESSFVALELVHEHRNYLPIYGLILAGAYLCVQFRPNRYIRARHMLLFCLLFLFAGTTALRSYQWHSNLTMRLYEVQHHPQSARANLDAGGNLSQLFLANPAVGKAYKEKAVFYLRRADELAPAKVGSLFSLMPLLQSDGAPMPAEIIAEIEDRLATHPVRFAELDSFRYFKDWLVAGLVSLPEEDVLGIFRAALGNPTVSDAMKASLFSLMSVYYAEHVHDLQQAVIYAIAATKASPKAPVHHLSLADIAMKLGNFELAKTELKTVQQLDELGKFHVQTKAMWKTLRQLHRDEIS